MKLDYLGEPSVRFYAEKQFQRLSLEKLAAYMRASESFDETMMGTVLSFAPKREPSSVEKLLRG
jgi:hypothetical protein